MNRATLFIGLFIIVFGAAFVSVLPSAAFNPLKYSYHHSSLVYTLFPQGWGFFTRDAQEAQIKVYQKVGDSFELINKSNGTPSYMLGLSRISRRQNVEFGQIVATIPDEAWSPCSFKELTACVPDSVVVRQNPFHQPLMKGEYLLVSSRPVPWAWARSSKPIIMPFRTIRLIITEKKENT